MSVMGCDVGSVGGCLYKPICRLQLAITVLPAMSAAFDEQVARRCNLVVCPIPNGGNRDVGGHMLPGFVR